MVGFGWSVSDVIAAIKIIVAVKKAFDEADGAIARYQQSTSFLDGLKVDLEHLKDYINANPNAKCSKDIELHLSKLGPPLTSLEKYLNSYKSVLDPDTVKVKKAYGRVKWTLDGLSDRVAKLENEVGRPFTLIMPLLLVQLL